MITLKLYSRPQCHLCEQLMDELLPMLGPNVGVELVDISEDAQLMRQYGLRIPVLHSGSEELSAWPFDRDKVAEFLAAQDD